MNWVCLLPTVARAAIRRPVGAVIAAWYLASGVLFAFLFGEGESLYGVIMHAANAGLEYGVVPVLPFMVVISACAAAVLRSRFWGMLVALAVFAAYFVSAQFQWLHQVTELLLPGGIVALVSGCAWYGNPGTHMSSWSALAVSFGWLVVLAGGATWRLQTWGRNGVGVRRSGGRRRFARRSTRQLLRRGRVADARAIRPGRETCWPKHLATASALVLALGVAACFLADDLSRAGVSHGTVYRALTHNRESQYLGRLADLLESGDYDAATQYVGPAGRAGVDAIREQIEEGDGSYTISDGETVGRSGKHYGTLMVNRAVEDANGETEIRSTGFLVDLQFEKGRWRVLRIMRAF